MDIIEFQTEIKNGIIEIPDEYRNQLTKHVRVILLPGEKSPTTKNFIEVLLAHPLRVKDFCPLTREEAHAR
jgi:hypothetical protein